MISVVVVALGGQAFGQGQVVSYYMVGGGATVIIPVVPVGGFVLTDIVFGATGDGVPIVFEEKLPGETERRPMIKLKVDGNSEPINSVFSLNSGVVFTEGAEVRFFMTGTDKEVTLSGYISSGTGTVPAVSTWGVVVMLALVIVAGSIVFRRVKMAA